ncbi:hypothetical protein [Sorangium sp. So ce861]|uniref:hypothetical protein n=1 Tax=Sorangium sp. So ce861 TaxID=3133323 RepID=UPI003F608E49
MTLAVVTGIGSGALHAVTGPDHILSLTPMAAAHRRSGFRIGLLWGLGHGLGTLIVCLALIALAAGARIEAVSGWSERAAALALVGMGAWSLRRDRRTPRGQAQEARDATRIGRKAALVGLVHGLTGAAALLLVLPAVFARSEAVRALFLLGFTAGSSLAMAGMTALMSWAMARAPAARPSSAGAIAPAEKLRLAASALSIGLGAWWLLRA